jgi:DNA-binding transcriptional MerR regulator
MLTMEDVCELSGLPRPTLQEWINKGLVVPSSGSGRGPGNRYQFSPLQAVGIALGAALRRTSRGCALSFVQELVEAFGGMPEEELRRRLAEGNTHFANSIYGTGHTVLAQADDPDRGDGEEYPLRPALSPPMYDWVDVKAIYDRVNEYMGRTGQEQSTRGSKQQEAAKRKR